MSKGQEFMQDLLYMNVLQPDDGYEVDFAIGTTFSLTMEGLISVPLAFSGMGDTKKPSEQTAMYLMEGIRRGCDKFILFCNKGFIHVPANSQPLYSMMEKSVFELSFSSCPLANFHPKMWVVREKPIRETGKKTMMKVIIMSRNLTFSNDLDVAIVMKGCIVGGDNKKNQPLADMIKQLADYVGQDDSRKNMINSLARDIVRVSHFDLEAPMSEKVYEFYPFLISDGGKSCGLNNKDLLSRLKGRQLLVISPFVDTDAAKGVLKEMVKDATKKYLVTNDNNVTDEILKMFDQVYVPNILLTEDEKTPIKLHAKIYLVEQMNEAVYMYIGSANATWNAFNRNSELMIGMRINHFLFDEVVKELMGGDISMYLPVYEPTVDSIEEQVKRQTEGDMEHIMRWAMNSLDSADIKKKHGDMENPYEVTLTMKDVDKRKYRIDNCCAAYDIIIRPLQNNYTKSLTHKLVWQLRLEELSEFYVVDVVSKNTGQHKDGVCKVKTKNLANYVESRNESIVNSIVRSDNIMQYIEMILSDFPEHTFETWKKRCKQGQQQGSSFANWWDGLTIYEKLLKMSYDDPSKLEDLKDVLGKIKSEDISEDLTNVLSAFGISLKRRKNYGSKRFSEEQRK